MFPLVATGLAPGELYSPIHLDYDPVMVTQLHEYIRLQKQESRLVILLSGQRQRQIEREMLDLAEMGYRSLELIGSYGHLCVATAAAFALNLGMGVYIPRAYLFIPPDVEPFMPIHIATKQLELRNEIPNTLFFYEIKENVHRFEPLIEAQVDFRSLRSSLPYLT